MCEEVEGSTFSRELVAAISETTFKQCEVLATDLEQFARYRHFCFQQGVWGTSRRVRKIISSPGSVHHSEQRLGTRLTPLMKRAKILNLTLLHRFSFFSPDMQSELQCQLRMSSCAVEEAPVSMSTSPVRLSDWRSGGRKGRREDGRKERRYRRNKRWKLAMAPNG